MRSGRVPGLYTFQSLCIVELLSEYRPNICNQNLQTCVTLLVGPISRIYNTYTMVAMGFMADNHTLTFGLRPHARVVIDHKSLATGLYEAE